MSNRILGLALGTLCGVALFAGGCSSSTRASSAPRSHPTNRGASSSATTGATGAQAGQPGAYCQTALQIEHLEQMDLAQRGTPTQISPSQAQALFSRLEVYLSKAVSEAPPSLQSATQALADAFNHLSQELAAHGYNPSYNPPDEQSLIQEERRFYEATDPWMSVHCPAELHPEAFPGSSELPAGGLHGTLPIPSSPGPTQP